MKPFCGTLLISFPSARPHTSACPPDLFIAIKILIATTEGRSSNVSSWRRRASTCTQKGRCCARRDRQCMLASRPAPRRCSHHAIAERHTQPGRSHLLSEVGVWVVVALLQSCADHYIYSMAPLPHVSLRPSGIILLPCHLAPLRSVVCALKSVTFDSRIGYVCFNLLLSIVVTFVSWVFLVLRRLVEKLYVNTYCNSNKSRYKCVKNGRQTSPSQLF